MLRCPHTLVVYQADIYLIYHKRLDMGCISLIRLDMALIWAGQGPGAYQADMPLIYP